MNTPKLLALAALAALAIGVPLIMQAQAETAPTAPVAPVAVKGVQPGDTAPDFTLKDLNGKSYNLAQLTKDGNTVVLEWFNPDCPAVKLYHEQSKFMSETYAKFKGKKVVWIAINSGAEGKQGAGKEHNAKLAGELGIGYPIALDSDGKVGKAYGAQTTPHMFVINAKRVVVFEGAPDEGGWSGAPAGTNYVENAIVSSMAGKAVDPDFVEPFGCSVKFSD